jgi:hypothetical protein
MDNRGRQRTIRQFYNNRGKNVYANAYKQKRAASPRPSNAFRRTQNTINAARSLQNRKSIFGRAPSPTRNGTEQRNNNEAKTINNMKTYRNLTGKSNNLHNTSRDLELINNEPRSWWDRFMVFGGTTNKRTHTKRNRTKRTKRNRN